MTDNNELRKIRRGLGEISQGFSIVNWKGNHAYIKHLSNLDNLEYESSYDRIVDELLEKGMPSEEEALKMAEDEGLWGPEEETEVQKLEAQIAHMEQSLKSDALISQIKVRKKSIRKSKEKLDSLLKSKAEGVPNCAEAIANERVNQTYIIESFFADRTLSRSLLTNEDKEYLSDQDLGKLIDIYNQCIGPLSGGFIKQIAVSIIFQNLHKLSDNAYDFFGKPVSHLTFLQAELYNYGQYYSRMLSSIEHQPPSDILEDPEKLEEWYTSNTNVRKMMEKNTGKGEGGTISIHGATKEDMDAAGLGDEVLDMHKIISERGELNIYEMAEIMG